MKKRQNRMPQRKISEELVMDSIERWGNDVDTAVNLALEALKAERDEVDVEVLEEPSRGFFGIGAKLARVRVTRKIKTEPEISEEKPVKKETRGPLRKEELTEEEKNSISSLSKEKKREPREGKGSRNKGKKKEEKKNYEELLPEEPVMPTVDVEALTVLEEHPGLDFLKNVSKEMGLDIDIAGKTDGKDLYFFIEGKDSGTIIGKRGATLDAIQYLTSLVVNKGEGEYVRVVVDAENYRAKREKSLEKLALRLANKVARSKRSYKLEPMNPYERKVIHATLQKDPRIITRSEGQDPSRRVIIEPK